jgi:hypothetical protein
MEAAAAIAEQQTARRIGKQIAEWIDAVGQRHRDSSPLGAADLVRRTWRRRRPIFRAAKSNAAPCEKPRSRCGERFASGAPREWSAHDACDIAARAQRTVGRGRIHDVKQRSVVRSRGALLRPGLFVSSYVPSLSRPPASPRGFGASGRRDSSNSVPR